MTKTPFYTDVGGECSVCGRPSPLRYVEGDHCVHCVMVETSYIPKGDFIVKDKPCPGGPHRVVLKKPRSTRCLICNPKYRNRSPRQIALSQGRKWYMPIKPCKKCGKIAPKRVNNGECRGCNPDTYVRFSDLYPPYLVISKKDAIDMGMEVYRTGNPCKHGHTGFRYTSSGNCVECVRMRAASHR